MKKILILIALIGFNLQAQQIEFDVGLSNKFEITTNGSDPLLKSANYYGMLGTETEKLWRVYAYDMFANNFVTLSDERAKENIQDLPEVLSKIGKVKVKKYDYKRKNGEHSESKSAKIDKSRKNKIGFLAQDLQKQFPELVDYNEKADVYGVNYGGMVPVLLQAIQELNAKVAMLEAR